MKLQKYVHRSVARNEYILHFDSFSSLEFVLLFFSCGVGWTSMVVAVEVANSQIIVIVDVSVLYMRLVIPSMY